jgi:phage-related protein
MHCFQKKTTKGIATPQRTMNLIQQRLRVVEAMSEKRSELHEK